MATAPLKPLVTFLGNMTGTITVKDLSISTSERAPLNSVLMHPQTLADISAASNGVIDIVNPVPQIPIDLKTTGAICEKLLLGGVGSLSDVDVKYISRVRDLPDTSLDKKLFDIADMIRGMVVLADQQGVTDEQLAPVIDPLTRAVESTIRTSEHDVTGGAEWCTLCEAELADNEELPLAFI